MFPRLPWWVGFPLSVVAYPLVIITAPIWIVLCLTEWIFLPSELIFRWKLKSAGRLKLIGRASFSELACGTIIVDSPTFSWAISRVWWTPEDVRALSPFPVREPPDPTIGMNDPPTAQEEADAHGWSDFDRWCCARYLDPAHGSAALIWVWHPDKKLERLRKAVPGIPVVYAWSGGGALAVLNRDP